MHPIGVLKSPYLEKFGIPRQPGLVPEAESSLKLIPGPGRTLRDLKDSLRGLEGFSHVWIIFLFHDLDRKEWKPLIRPPRLGGVKKVGVLASRSPHRPNPIGLSLVEISSIDLEARGGPEIHLLGGDFLDQTPVLDLKPYLPYADSAKKARIGWVEDSTSARIPNLKVTFALDAVRTLKALGAPGLRLKKLLKSTLRLDPRPAFQRGNAEYAARIGGFDVHWAIQAGSCQITRLAEIQKTA